MQPKQILATAASCSPPRNGSHLLGCCETPLIPVFVVQVGSPEPETLQTNHRHSYVMIRFWVWGPYMKHEHVQTCSCSSLHPQSSRSPWQSSIAPRSQIELSSAELQFGPGMSGDMLHVVFSTSHPRLGFRGFRTFHPQFQGR